MVVELLVGLQVNNPELYAEYRRLMTPLLHQHQGDFGCDFIVQKVLSLQILPSTESSLFHLPANS